MKNSDIWAGHIDPNYNDSLSHNRFLVSEDGRGGEILEYVGEPVPISAEARRLKQIRKKLSKGKKNG